MELDKSLAGAHENQSADSGVASRVLAYFLTWLCERNVSAETENRVFVMVTMNRTAGVPPELLRAGRFDRVWSVDLPDQDERTEILSIHLNKRSVPATSYGKSLVSIAKATDQYTGAELEEVIISARNDAYDARMGIYEQGGSKGNPPSADQVRPTVEEILAAAEEITPVARLDSESISAIRKFCAENCYPVNGERVVDSKRTRESRKVDTTRAADRN